MPLAAGTRLGPYEVLAPLGAGGMGEVYRANDTRLGRDVAVKLLPPSFANDPGRLLRFEREARAAGSLHHPNLLSLFDVGSHDSGPYLVTELLEGATLAGLIEEGAIPSRKAADYAAQIARGLAAAHAKGIIHRDLKPENVFVTNDGRVKVLDFGLARLTRPADAEKAAADVTTATSPTDAGVLLGTVGYMSPEQVKRLPVDERSDIFALGVVLYEMLSGKRAFKRETPVETLSAILKEDPPEIGPSVPPALERILRRCLEKNPEERFRSGHDLALALEAISGVSVTTGSDEAPRLHWPSHRLRAAFLALALAALPLLTYVAGLRRGEKPIPTWQRLTFRRGNIGHARFAPDGRTIIYSAAWDGDPLRLFSVRTDGRESHTLDIADADILAISRNGEMAIALGRKYDTPGASVGGLLARAPLAGGAPREMIEDVEAADWSPDGTTLAVVRNIAGQRRLEFPLGKVVYEGDMVFSPRFSPAGDLVAFADTAKGIVGVVDRSGKVRTVVAAGDPWSLAWSAKGDEILYGAGAVTAAALSGQQRVLARFPMPTVMRIEDVFPDGRVLITLSEVRTGVQGLSPGEAQERDLSWLGSSYASGLSPDGRTLLIAVGDHAYLRKIGTKTPPVRLGEGAPLGLSPDLKWALVWRSESELEMLPTGPGEARVLKSDGLEYLEAIGGAGWTPDGSAFLLVAREKGRPWRVYVQSVAGGRARPVTPEGIAPRWPRILGQIVSPDGRHIAVVDGERKIGLYPVDGGEVASVPGPPEPGDLKCWSADGRSLFVTESQAGQSARIFRRELATGRREPRKEIAPTDPAGMFRLDPMLTPDGRSYVYTYYTGLANLYLVEGLR